MSDRPALARLTVKDLRALANARGIAGSGKLKKGELIDLLALPTAPPLPVPGAAPAGSSRAGAVPPPAASGTRTPEPGLPVPASYGTDRLVLLVQDPGHVFAYWELAPATLQRAQGYLGEGGAPVLLLNTASGTETREVDLRGGNYYLAVAPGGSYEAELALRDRSGRLHPLLRSNRVATPVAGPSWRTDATWVGVDEDFAELLERAGLPGAAPSSAETARRRSAWEAGEGGEAGTWPLPSSHSLPSSHTLAGR